MRSLGLVPETGLEPVRPITGPRILSPLRLPFHHSGSLQQSTKSRPSWQCPAASFALDVGCLVSPYAGLPSSVRSRSGQPCSPFEAGALPVLRPARPRFRFGLTRAPHESPTSGGYRRIHIRLRGRVLCNPPRLKGFRSAAARHSGFALGYPLATLGPHFVRRLPDRDRAWHLWSSSSRGECPRLRYRSTRRCSRVFRSPFAS